MLAYRTLRPRGHDPIQAIAAALHSYVRTGTLPPWLACALRGELDETEIRLTVR